MPLTEQPGLFIGRRWNSKDWYVLDPAADAVATQRAWEARYARTNRPIVVRVPMTILSIVLFLALATGATFAASWMSAYGTAAVLVSAVIVGLGFLIGAILAGGLYSLVLPRRKPSGDRLDEVVAVRPAVSKWAGAGDVSVSDVWQLSTSIDRVSNVWELVGEWGDNFDNETHQERPTWALERLLQPAVFAELALQQKQLAEIAARLSFPLTGTLMQEPKPFREYDED